MQRAGGLTGTSNAITGLSVAICFFIGGVETLGIFPMEIHSLPQNRGFWGFMHNFNINTAGFVIVGMFVLTWATAMGVWGFRHMPDFLGATARSWFEPGNAELKQQERDADRDGGSHE